MASDTGGLRILFADDSPSVRMLVRTTLVRAGYAVLEAADGQEALDILMGDAGVDLVVTDLHMPRLDGLEMVRRARALPHRRYVPIVMLTAESQTERMQEGIKVGLTAWIVKPFQPDMLLRVIAKVLGKRRVV